MKVLFLLLVPSFLLGQPADSLRFKADSLFLNVVIPETDTVRTPSGRYRFAASTQPSAKAFVQGIERKVYPSGAFVGLVDVPIDTSVLQFVVTGKNMDTLSKSFVFIRSRPLQTSSRDTLTIETVMMEPSEHLWLRHGEDVKVRFKGSPGYEASFSIDGVESGIPMRELSPAEAGGLEGIYAGQYTINEEDEAVGARIEFKLRKSFWSSEEALSSGTVSFAPGLLPRIGEVTGKRSFLNVGLGSDRLGGAKLGYIDPGIRLRIIGKVGRQYKIQLSASMVGWIPEEFVRLLPEGTPDPVSLVGSISVAGTPTEDVVTVGLNQRLPYTSEQRTNPTAILVDIYGATSNTNWITQHLSAEGVESVSWDQVAEDQYQLRINLKSGSHWGYDVGYGNGTGLRIRIRRPPVIAMMDTVLKNLIIAVDAGHGGDNSGAAGATGIREMDVTLSIANHLRDTLKHYGATVVLTRPDTNGVSMASRADAVIASRAHILVSIHCNSIGYTSDPERVQGTATFYRFVGFRPLAAKIYDRMLELGLAQFGVVGSFNFSLNGLTQLPNVLVETAFLSHPEEEMKLMDDGFRRQIAGKVVQGLKDYLRTHAIPPPAPTR